MAADVRLFRQIEKPIERRPLALHEIEMHAAIALENLMGAIALTEDYGQADQMWHTAKRIAACADDALSAAAAKCTRLNREDGP